MSIPSNINNLEPELQRIIHSNITLDEDEVKAANKYLQSVLIGSMENIMKSQDETFRKLYKEPQYTGSYYENLRVGCPNEFDINLVLELPIKEEYIVIDRAGTQPGFTKIKVQKVFKPNTSDPVKRKVESWLQEGYLSRPKVINWLQGVVDRALTNITWPFDMSVELKNNVTVKRKMSGPAVTLLVNMGSVVFDVDLVPVFRFGRDKWPARPIRQPNNLPRDINSTMTWCVVPKAPRRAAYDDYQWRMSFYMIEKGLMRDLNNMKPVIKLFKLLRDKQGWGGLSSYYIKTLFMWEQEIQKNERNFWRKGLGYLFMHMLIRLEGCLKQKRIKFFWDENSNLLEALDVKFIENMEGRATFLRKLLERALNGTAVNYNSLSEVVEYIFTTPSKSPSRLNTASPPPPGVYGYSEGSSNSSFQNSNGSSQQTSSISWASVGIGIGIAALSALFLGSMINRNRND